VQGHVCVLVLSLLCRGANVPRDEEHCHDLNHVTMMTSRALPDDTGTIMNFTCRLLYVIVSIHTHL